MPVDDHGLALEQRVRVLGVDPRDPLHDVEPSKRGVEPEVAAERQVVRAGRVVGKLGWIEIAGVGLRDVQLSQQPSESLEVAATGIGADVQIFGTADHPVDSHRHAADDDVLDLRAGEAAEQRFRIEHARGLRPLLRLARPGTC